MYAKVIDRIKLQSVEHLPDGHMCAKVACPNHDTYTSLPDGIEYDQSVYGLTGWNSDTGVAYYRTDACLGREVR